MSGVRRFLSRREKSPRPHGHSHSRSQSQHNSERKPPRNPAAFTGVFVARQHDSSHEHKKTDKDEEKKSKAILERLRHYGIENLTEANVEYALHHAQGAQGGDADAAFKLLMLLEDTYEGIVKPFNPDMKMLGAVNREGTTCYLDALLFSMFARLDSFEALLYDTFPDTPRKRLAGLLRLWVNLLRTGRLITTDLTAHLQSSLAECGWRDAGRCRQQDPSEAFTFITGQLELPMLTLKMDMYHTGKEDPQDDHKFVNERLLEVAIPDEPPEGRTVLTLEDCLEHYFNNRIEVKRHLENQRRNTLKSASISQALNPEAPTKVEKESGTHVEVLEIPETPIAGTPSASTPIVETPTGGRMFSPAEQLRPTLGRKRADSIFSQRRVEVLNGIEPVSTNVSSNDPETPGTKERKLSTRTEVLMPAWQFFKLLPWYTDNMPTSEAQVAAHFSKQRPVLGICLKRYSYTLTGQARKLETYVDIPLEIAVPNFVSGDEHDLGREGDEVGPIGGNFRLVLQAVVCHRGVSVHEGHYICLCRGRAGNMAQSRQQQQQRQSLDDENGDEMMEEDPWMRFDDLARERVSHVNIQEALKKEMPYMLFYQVLPIEDEERLSHELPSYTEATSRSQSETATTLLVDDKPLIIDESDAVERLEKVKSEPVPMNIGTIASNGSLATESADFAPPPSQSERPSLDVPRSSMDPSRSNSDTGAIPESPDARRRSIAGSTSGGSIRTDPASLSGHTTPSDEKGTNPSLLSVVDKLSGSRRGSRISRMTSGGSETVKERSRSRNTSTDASNRFSLNMSKLTQRMSRNDIADAAPPVQPSEHVAADLAGLKDASTTSITFEEPEKPTAPSPAPDSARRVTGHSRSANASKESITAPTKPRHIQTTPTATQKLKKDKAAAAGGKKKHHEDRDCVLM